STVDVVWRDSVGDEGPSIARLATDLAGAARNPNPNPNPPSSSSLSLSLSGIISSGTVCLELAEMRWTGERAGESGVYGTDSVRAAGGAADADIDDVVRPNVPLKQADTVARAPGAIDFPA
ncbi:hypothetical protein FRC09_009595, partial [Ceratobasidium sp. 395]